MLPIRPVVVLLPATASRGELGNDTVLTLANFTNASSPASNSTNGSTNSTNGSSNAEAIGGHPPSRCAPAVARPVRGVAPARGDELLRRQVERSLRACCR